MSAAGRGRERRLQDAYSTPQPLADAIVKWALSKAVIAPTCILEPGCGASTPFLNAVAERLPASELTSELLGALRGRTYRGVELADGPPANPKNQGPIVSGTDYLTWEPTHGFDLIITNPPYSLAREFLEKSFTLLRSPGLIVFLLRLPWLESRSRLELHRVCPPDYVGVIVPRPSFTGGGTDATAYAAFAYCRPARFLVPRLDWIEWKGGKKPC